MRTTVRAVSWSSSPGENPDRGVPVRDPQTGGRGSCSTRRQPMSRHLRGDAGAPQNWMICVLRRGLGRRSGMSAESALCGVS
jgi:hypothetical protein